MAKTSAAPKAHIAGPAKGDFVDAGVVATDPTHLHAAASFLTHGLPQDPLNVESFIEVATYLSNPVDRCLALPLDDLGDAPDLMQIWSATATEVRRLAVSDDAWAKCHRSMEAVFVQEVEEDRKNWADSLAFLFSDAVTRHYRSATKGADPISQALESAIAIIEGGRAPRFLDHLREQIRTGRLVVPRDYLIPASHSGIDRRELATAVAYALSVFARGRAYIEGLARYRAEAFYSHAWMRRRAVQEFNDELGQSKPLLFPWGLILSVGRMGQSGPLA